MDAETRWLTAVWPFMREQMPAAPARVVEIGCGPRGGFVPTLQAEGFAAVGVDPQAPDEPSYHRIAFEGYRLAEPVQAVVASTSFRWCFNRLSPAGVEPAPYFFRRSCRHGRSR